MRRALSLLVVLSALLLVVPGSPAMASETHHGTFSGGTGYNNGTGLEGYPAGTYTLAPEGTWNLKIGANSVQVTGALENPTCPDAPCSFVMNLSTGTRWTLTGTADGYRTFSSFVDWGAVTFDVDLTYQDSGEATFEFVIQGCPHGWERWVVNG